MDDYGSITCTQAFDSDMVVCLWDDERRRTWISPELVMAVLGTAGRVGDELAIGGIRIRLIAFSRRDDLWTADAV